MGGGWGDGEWCGGCGSQASRTPSPSQMPGLRHQRKKSDNDSNVTALVNTKETNKQGSRKGGRVKRWSGVYVVHCGHPRMPTNPRGHQRKGREVTVLPTGPASQWTASLRPIANGGGKHCACPRPGHTGRRGTRHGRPTHSGGTSLVFRSSHRNRTMERARLPFNKAGAGSRGSREWGG